MRRYVPDRSLPAVPYIPGKTPRPASSLAEPSGAQGGAFDPNAWSRSPSYLWGFDLLASGFAWEAHEAWEGLWRTLERRSPEALLLQALIKLAAAQVKQAQGQASGVRTHARGAAALFRQVAAAVAPQTVCMGVDLSAAAACAEALPDEGGVLALELVGIPPQDGSRRQPG